MIPYGKQDISQEDINSVVEAMNGVFLTTGPAVLDFEQKFANFVGAKYAVSVANGTAALHLACLASGLQGGELIISPMSFAASANSALYCSSKPVFVDIDETTGLIDENLIEKEINDKTKAIIPVHYAGQPCNMHKIKELADKHSLIVIEDACHALGAVYHGSKIGSCKYSKMSVFSFHPVKHITTFEGGMITTNSKDLYEKLTLLRNHGISKNSHIMSEQGAWHQEMILLGYNYRLTDVACALGISQLGRLPDFVKRRREIAKDYDDFFRNLEEIKPLKQNEGTLNSYHLYVIKVKNSEMRKSLYDYLEKKGINGQVHYLPIYLHPYYQDLGYERGLCPVSERFYEQIISIPMFSSLKNSEQEHVTRTINEFFKGK